VPICSLNFQIIFCHLKNSTPSFHSEIHYWTDSLYYKPCIFHGILDVVMSYTNSFWSEFIYSMNSWYNFSYLRWFLMVSQSTCIYFEDNGILSWISTIIYTFLMCSSMLSLATHTLTSKWTKLLNELLVKNIHFLHDLQCSKELLTFTSRCTQLLNEFLLKTIYFSYDLHYCHELHLSIWKWLYLLNGLVLKLFIARVIFNIVTSYTHLPRTEINW
jgi:hypothetical protein